MLQLPNLLSALLLRLLRFAGKGTSCPPPELLAVSSAASMSYVRLLRLPPLSEAAVSSRSCRRNWSACCGGANNLRDLSVDFHARNLLQHRRYGACENVVAVSGDRAVFGIARSQTVRGVTGSSYLSEDGNATGVLAEEPSWKTTTTCTERAALSAPRCLEPRPSPRGSWHPDNSKSSLPFWGMSGTGRGPETGRAWSGPKSQWQSLRAFASVPPEQSDPKSDSPDKSRQALAGQKAFHGGLLKPSDKEIEPVKDESAQRFKDLQEEYTLYEAARKNPRQTSEQVEQSQMSLTRKKVVAMIKTIPVMTWDATKALVLFVLEIIKNPRVLKDKLAEAQYHLKEFGRHYWLGCKLLWGDMKTAKKIINRMLRGFPMTRRERKQLLRTASDIFRMVPLAAFVLIPFMEFLLPVALRIFPNMLPSTFQDNLKEEEKLKKELRLRMAYAGFLQETVTAMAVKKKTRAEDGGESDATTGELTDFIEKAKMGEITNQDIPKFAKMFKDELTMDNISRSGLANMCRYMGLPPFGNDNFLRFQLRSKLRAITQDDQRILWEGVSSLTKQELQEACRERGMRATGLTKQGYIRQLSQWLDLSTKKSVPISLLIMSRAFTLQAPDPAKALAQSISAMDDDVVTEVMIEAASSEEQRTPEYRTRKLESLTRQNELIEEENRKREEAKQAQEAEKAEEAKKTEEAKAAEMEEADILREGDVASKKSAQDEAVDKVIENAALEAAARTTPGDVSPKAVIREGRQEFVAASGTEGTKGEEPVTTEADVVAPTAGVEAGNRLVDPKQAKKSTRATKSSGAKKAKAKTEPDERAQDLANAVKQVSESEEEEDTTEDTGSKLTVAELAALESLASPSSVEKEKAQLAMMKAALQESLGKPDDGERINGEASDGDDAEGTAAPTPSPSSEKEDAAPFATKEQARAQTKQVAPAAEGTLGGQQENLEKPSVPMAADDVAPGSDDAVEPEEMKAQEPAVDKSVERLQTKIASMLNRLELEIESVEKRIGDKMHVLDRDKDGMVSAEEIAHVVQHVLATASTEKEAKAIAEEMDTDSDGQISVAELIAWVKKNSEQDPEDVFNQLYQRKTEEESREPPTKE